MVAIYLSLAAFLLSLLVFWRQHMTANQERIHTICSRLFDISSQLMSYPEVQVLIYNESGRTTPFFTENNPHNALYFRVKNHIYDELNLFDEILVILKRDTLLSEDFEIGAWEAYIFSKMRHPLYKELFDREAHIWGPRFQEFRKTHAEEIKKPCDPEIF